MVITRNIVAATLLGIAPALLITGKPKTNNINLPSFPGVLEVRSALPGRIRLYMPKVSACPDLAAHMRKSLLGTQAVNGVELNPVISTVLIEYDQTKVEAQVVVGAAAKLMQLDEQISAPQGKVTEGLRKMSAAANYVIMDKTGGILDLHSCTALTLAGLGIWRMSCGVMWPCAFNLFWWAAEALKDGRRI